MYRKLSRSSVTIFIITPNAVNHKKGFFDTYDDWIYDELRYSLEDRGNNRTNGLIAVYTPEAESMVCEKNHNGIVTIKDFDNIARKNMFNVKNEYKTRTDKYYDSNYDSYCSLVSWEDFCENPSFYIDVAYAKKEHRDRYVLTKRINCKKEYWF